MWLQLKGPPIKPLPLHAKPRLKPRSRQPTPVQGAPTRTADRPRNHLLQSGRGYGFTATWPQATMASTPKPSLIVVSRMDTVSNVPNGAIAPGGAN